MMLFSLIIVLGAASSVVSTPIRHVVVKPSGEVELDVSTPLHTIPCSSTELAEFALQLAVGPVAEPKCRPSPGQALQPKMPKTQPQMLTKIAGGSASSAVLRTPDSAPSAGVHFAHLYVVQSSQEWCPHPCMSPSWELAAPKPEQDSPYLLLEAAIWRQSRTVTLYRFDAAWEKRARAAYNEFCEGKSWGCAAYDSFRESRSLFKAGPWPAEADSDPQMLSSFLKDAFSRIFDEMHKLAGPQAYIGLTYSGHGGLADGSLFAGALKPEDTVKLLQHATAGNQSNGKLSLLNFGGNCNEGRWNMLETLHPFANWILASDLEVGGLAVNASRSSAMVQAMLHLRDVETLKGGAETRASPRDAVKQVVNARRQLWEGEQRSDIIHQRLRQSLSGFKTASFVGFKEALSRAFRDMSGDIAYLFSNYVKDASCDVLVALRLLDTSFSEDSGPADATINLVRRQGKTERHKSGSLELQFQALRSFYASTKTLFAWDKDTNGLMFNSKQQKCDFTGAFGRDADDLESAATAHIYSLKRN